MDIRILIVAVYATVVATKFRYNGYKIYQVYPESHEHNSILLDLDKYEDIQVLNSINKEFLPVRMVVAPQFVSQFLDVIKDIGIRAYLLVDDLESLIDVEARLPEGYSFQLGSMDWIRYHKLHEINAWLKSLAKQYPKVVTLKIGGISYEGRYIQGLQISHGAGKPVVFIEGGIHAREWISPATVTYIINELLTSPNANIKKLAENFEWHLFPSVNPDGYVYSHEWERLWRKNRRPTIMGTVNKWCSGVDLNRNWDFHWHDGESSKCSEKFQGSSPFSEPETKSLSNYMTQFKSRMIGYISFHSYGQLLLLPFGNTSTHLANYNQMKRIGLKAMDALKSVHGTSYRVGNIPEILYPAFGASGDWVKDTLDVPIQVTYELRPNSSTFELPHNQILPNCEEVMASLVVMFEEAIKEGIAQLPKA